MKLMDAMKASGHAPSNLGSFRSDEVKGALSVRLKADWDSGRFTGRRGKVRGCQQK